MVQSKVLQDNFLVEVRSREKVGNSSRFKTEHVIAANGEFFVKTALTPELNERIKFQVEGSRAYSRLLKDTDWLRTEEVLAKGEDWLITRWLPGGAIASPEAFSAGQNLDALEVHAKVVAKLDEIAEANQAETGGKQIILGRHSLEPKTYSESLAEKFIPYLARPDFDQGIIKAGLDFFEISIPSLQATWQHGDMTPWHIFKDGEKLVLIDCEHVRSAWPRYYDLGNFYSQLHVRFGLAGPAEQMVNRFSEIRGQDARQSRAFWAMAMLRALRRALEHEDDPEMVQRAFKLATKILNK